MLNPSVSQVSVTAKQTPHVIMPYGSDSSINVKVLYKGKEILLFLLQVDGSYFTDVVTIPSDSSNAASVQL